MMQRDLTFQYGADFVTAFACYDEDDFETWTGEWSERRTYAEREAALSGGTPYVALLPSRGAEPGAPGSEPFWRPLEPLDLTDDDVWLAIDGVLELECEHDGGRISVHVDPAAFADAPSSARHRIEIRSPDRSKQVLVSGTALFRKP
jgi:hypothetical protein